MGTTWRTRTRTTGGSRRSRSLVRCVIRATAMSSISGVLGLILVCLPHASTVSLAASTTGSGVVVGDMQLVREGPQYCYWFSDGSYLTGSLNTSSEGTITLGPWTATWTGEYRNGICTPGTVSGVTYDASPLGGSSVQGICSGTDSPTATEVDLVLDCSAGSGTGGLDSFTLTIAETIGPMPQPLEPLPVPGSPWVSPAYGTYSMT